MSIKKRKNGNEFSPTFSPNIIPNIIPNIGSPNIIPNIIPIELDAKFISIETQTDRIRDEQKEIETDFSDIYDEKDIEFLKKLKKRSMIVYQKFLETKKILLNRSITIEDILIAEITNEKRANLLEKYESLQQLIPHSLDYNEVRNQIRNQLEKYTNKKISCDDPDIELFKKKLSEMKLSLSNFKIIEEKINELFETEKGDEKSKLKRWLQLVTSLPFDKFSKIDKDILLQLEETKNYLDKNLFGMNHVKERLLIFLNKKLRGENNGCNIALVGNPGVGKCLHPDTPVRLYDFTVKKAKEIKVGDYLMGDDSSPREVLSLTFGKEEMFKIRQEFGESYIVNKSHILTLERKQDQTIIDIPIIDVITKEHLYTPVNGYFSGNVSCESFSYGVLYSGNKNELDISYPKDFPNLPFNYLEWSIKDKYNFYYYLTTNSESRVYISDSFPIRQIVDLLHSAGIRCKREKDFIIFKEQNEIFRIISMGIGDYVGFTISGNERFLLGDWTATHNTAIAKCLSKCLELPFEQVSFGGISTPEFLLGHDYTYIGSRPGEISRCLSRMGTKNGILFFDEFDKASDRKEIMSTLLHITDFSQNNEFRDHYFPDLCQDLSKIWFIYSMNELPKDPAMLDRLEIIKVDGYTFNEKKTILKEYILPKLSNELKIQNEFILDEKVLQKLISKEKSGVRDLERSINLLMEKIYFFLYNMGMNYNYDWFLKMKESFKNGKLIIGEELIPMIDEKSEFINMYT